MLGIAGIIGALFVGSLAIVETEEPSESTEPDPDLDPAAKAGGESAVGAGQVNLLDGGDGDDLIHGSKAGETIDGGAGDDWIDGGYGDDLLIGGDGADELHGGRGADDLAGGTGDDQLFGHNGDDILDGGAGDDMLVGSDGDDVVDGGDGDDQLQGSAGDDILTGGAGVDQLQGGSGDDTLSGVVLDDAGYDLDQGDYLNGGGGADVLTIGSGDIASGGSDTDVFEVGTWIAPGKTATIMDYDPAEDQIVLMYDQSCGDVPEVSIQQNPDVPDMADILVDGELLASVVDAAGLTADQISLVPTS